MKSLVCTAAASLIALIVANVTGIIGFRYPQVVENEPLHNPIKVIRVGGNCLILADSRIIRTKSDTQAGLAKALAESNYFVDIESVSPLVTVYAQQNGWVCGTPWAKPVRIPLIADPVYRNRRELIAVGDFVEPE